MACCSINPNSQWVSPKSYTFSLCCTQAISSQDTSSIRAEQNELHIHCKVTNTVLVRYLDLDQWHLRILSNSCIFTLVLIKDELRKAYFVMPVMLKSSEAVDELNTFMLFKVLTIPTDAEFYPSTVLSFCRYLSL